MSNLQLFPVSSLLIGSTLLADCIADGALTLIHLEWSWVWAPGEPDCACLFRLLESILRSVREDSCYYNSVLFSEAAFLHSLSSSPPQQSTRPPGNSPSLWDRNFWYLASLQLCVHLHPVLSKSNTSLWEIWFTQHLRKCDSLCGQMNCACEQPATPHPHCCYITVSMDTHFGNIWKSSDVRKKIILIAEVSERPAGTGAGMQLFIAVFKRVPL